MSRRQYNRDPEKRAAKRAKQRAAGYQGVKKTAPPAVMQHNGGKPFGGRSSKDKKFYESGGSA